MATISVPTSTTLSAVTYAARDVINVGDGAVLMVNGQWSTKPQLLQALGTGRIEAENTSTSSMMVLEFDMGDASNLGGILTQQNAVGQARGNWLIVGTSTGANNQVLFNVNSVGGKAIDFPTVIEVETGSGTNVWETWQAVPEDVPGGTVNTLGFNAPNLTVGTVAVAANGVVTGTGTAFITAHAGLPFKLPSIARDFVVSAFASNLGITIQEANGTTYTGGVIAAGSSYILRSGSLISQSQVGSGDLGKILFFNPLTGAVRMGDGTNGTKIPTGAKIRIPNIHWNSALQQTTLATAITTTAAQAFTLTAPIGPLTNAGANVNQAIGTLLLISGSTVERIYFATRTAGGVVSATGQLRGQAGTTAATFPVGTAVYWIPGSVNYTNNAGFNCNPSGTFDLQICSVGLRFRSEFSNYAAVMLKQFGCQTLLVGNGAGTYDLDGFSVLGMSYQVPSAVASSCQFPSMLGRGSIRNGYQTNNIPAGASANGFALSNVQNAQVISNLRARLWGRSASSAVFRAFSFVTVKCATPINGIYMAGGNLLASASTDLDVKEIFVSSLPNGNTNSSADVLSPVNNTSLVDSTLRGIQIWDGGTAMRGTLITTDTASEKVVCHNKGYPVIEGSGQILAVVSDQGLDSITANFSVANPRVLAAQQSYLAGTVTTNSGGRMANVRIDSSVAGTAGSGGASKSGLWLDIVAGPGRAFQSVATASIIPNLINVQPMVVLTNLAGTVGSVYVGPFSAASALDMYVFGGGAYLDNLGRIYYPSAGDFVIIKSVRPLRGFTDFEGEGFDFNFNLGSGTNPIPAGTTLEFRMVNWGVANTGAWISFTTNADLRAARAALAGFSSAVGVDLQTRITGTTAVAGRYVMSLRFPVTIDNSYSPPVGYTDVGVSGAQAGTLIAAYLNANPASPELQASLVLTGTSGNVPMGYDYDNVPVPYRLVARKAGWTFSSLTGTYKKTALSIPITQTQVVDINGTPLYAAGVTGVAVDHAAQTITVSASRSAAQIWSAVQDSMVLIDNATKAEPFVTSNGAGFFSSYTLVVTGGITAGNISSDVTLNGSLAGGVVITGTVNVGASGVLANGVQINGDVIRIATANISNVQISGALEFTPTVASTYTQTNCAVGIIRNNNPEAGTITVRQIGGSILGSGEGINILYPVSIARTGGSAFNIVAQIVTDGEVVQDLGYQANVTSFSADVPLGSGIQFTMWSLGFVSYVRSYTPSATLALEVDLIADPDIDTALNVAAYLANISVTYSGATFTATFLSNMVVPGIEPVKAVVHRLLGQESPMRALLPPGTETSINIEADEIQLNKSTIFLRLGPLATDVQVLGYFNTAPAVALDAGYIINPRRAGDNLRVELPLVKPALDSDQLALAVAAKLSATTSQVERIAKLHGLGATLTVTPTSRTAGSVVQTISTAGDTTTVSEA